MEERWGRGGAPFLGDLVCIHSRAPQRALARTLPLLPRPRGPARPALGNSTGVPIPADTTPPPRPGLLAWVGVVGSSAPTGGCWLPLPRPSQRSFQNPAPTALLEIDGVKRAFNGLIDWLPLSCPSTCFWRGGSQPRRVPGRWLSASPQPVVDFSTSHHRPHISPWKLRDLPLLHRRLNPGKEGRRRAPCRRLRRWIQRCRAGAISPEGGRARCGVLMPACGSPPI